MLCTTNTKEQIPGTCNAILFPLLAHNFTTMIRPGDILSRQTTKTTINLIDKTVTVNVEQPSADAGVFSYLLDICGGINALHVDHLDGKGETICRLTFHHARAIEHTYVLDYSAVASATHVLTFSFEDVSVRGLPNKGQES